MVSKFVRMLLRPSPVLVRQEYPYFINEGFTFSEL